MLLGAMGCRSGNRRAAAGERVETPQLAPSGPMVPCDIPHLTDKILVPVLLVNIPSQCHTVPGQGGLLFTKTWEVVDDRGPDAAVPINDGISIS